VVEERLDGFDQRLGVVEERLDGFDQRLGVVEQGLDGVERRLDGVNQRIVAESQETRRQFGVMTESLREDIKLLVDGLEINRRHVAALHADIRTEFASRDAVLRAAFADIHRDIAALRQRGR
jgi:hypothetical protein